ncbi:MAG: nuclease superfamily protein [Pedosphaera sp.]|nr:nuclease superfamily protein [Pedosphaera sp.]
MDVPLLIYSVYIIKNPSGKLYIGLTDDVARRLAQHNSGVSTWTRNKGPWLLLWEKPAMSLSDSRKLELELKRQKGGDRLYRLTGLARQAHHPACGTIGSNPTPATNLKIPDLSYGKSGFFVSN